VTQENYFQNRYVGSSANSGVSLPSLSRIADAYGITYRQIANNEEVVQTVRAVISNLEPEIIEVMVDPKKHLMPKLGSYIKEDGTMASKPLEDLLPLLDRTEFRSNMFTQPLE
jgi:acetolactate synthase-1/2/3 large subunit